MKMKQILENSFYQLLMIYVLLVFFISINFYSKYSLHFEIFAAILAILGFFILEKGILSKNKILEDNVIHYFILIIAFLITLTYRIIPYIENTVPLGYDVGIYKYAIESGLQNLDLWILSSVEPGFLYLMTPLSLLFTTNAILIEIFIIFNLLLAFSIYLVSKEYFNKTTAIFSILLYSLSIIQFKTFELMYYKNIIGLAFMLFAIYFHKKDKLTWFVIFAALVGMIHRPTFYIFGLSYFAYTFMCLLKNKKLFIINFLLGIAILLLAIIPYLGKFGVSLTTVLPWVIEGFVNTGQSPGTFINIFTYQLLTLAYLPFALIGLFYLAKNKKFDILFMWAIINASIVYFQFFFFNRFIIHLDVILVILASVGFSIILQKRKMGGLLIAILLTSLLITSFLYVEKSEPLVAETELNIIKSLAYVETNAYVMSTSGYYSTWLQGYSNRKVIAPGLFDYNKHTKPEWENFWITADIEETKRFLDVYEKPLYIFIGKYQNIEMDKFEDSCFNLYNGNLQTKNYKYTC